MMALEHIPLDGGRLRVASTTKSLAKSLTGQASDEILEPIDVFWYQRTKAQAFKLGRMNETLKALSRK
ncbi:hypothetical protein L2A60_19790 [Acidiphilium iwatense]|uniref:Uncharacterized protein n=1 Tax=Acidiphilium iwatense TaxID=768198 RepID=A0ABS9E3I3_9PROT|nr:hypothetical protein [Acidiphilium iwatense]